MSTTAMVFFLAVVVLVVGILYLFFKDEIRRSKGPGLNDPLQGDPDIIRKMFQKLDSSGRD